MAEFKTGWLKKAGERVLAWSHAKTCFYNKSKNITVYEKLQELDDKVDKEAGDIANTKVGSITASTDSYPVPAANDTVKVGLGKIVKFFEDVKNWMAGVCLIGQIVNNCVTNNAKLPLSAAQGKALMDLFTKLNSDKASLLHASTGKAYGPGSETHFGHVKVSNEYKTPVGGALEAVAASQHCVYNVYNGLSGSVNGIKEHFFGTSIVDASAEAKGINYNLEKDNTYIVTATKGTNENETAVWILNTRNSTVVVTSLRSVSGITYRKSGLTFCPYFSVGIVAETACFKLS